MAKVKNSLNAVYTEAREDGAKLLKTFLIPLDHIVCDWDENIRDENEDHIANWVSTFAKGDYVPPILVEMREGVPHVIEGFHRYTAKEQCYESYELDATIECKEWKGDEDEKLITMRNSSNGLPLTFLEDAEVIYDIKESGDYTAEALGQRLGISRTAVNNKILVAEACDEIKDYIRDKVVSATTVVEIITKHGQEAALAQVEHLIDRANRQGVAKVKGSGPKAFSAAKMRTALEYLADGLDYAKFAENYDKLKDGEQKLTLKLTKAEMYELMNIVEDYIEHTGD